MEYWKQFRQLWASEFKHLTDSDGILYWQKFIDKVEDWSTLEEAVKILSEEYHQKKKENNFHKMPHLADLRELYFKLKKMEQKSNLSGGSCAMCNNSGYVTNVQILRSGHSIICDPRTPQRLQEGDSIGVVVGSCTCFHGDQRIPMSHRSNCVRNRFGSADGGTGFELEYIKQCRQAGEES